MRICVLPLETRVLRYMPYLPTSLNLEFEMLTYQSRSGGEAYATACRAVLLGCKSQGRLHFFYLYRIFAFCPHEKMFIILSCPFWNNISFGVDCRCLVSSISGCSMSVDMPSSIRYECGLNVKEGCLLKTLI